ncbi:DoxX family membrane protein [Micromonospora sp. U56]|uniref:DoxX family membrane protein n=1 Tax=Micromonospora sp. U56 TaxID=2824900 RepID=UPI0027DAFF9F|nr:DoxX family membrane protein [Micromonospora sp. U56]
MRDADRPSYEGAAAPGETATSTGGKALAVLRIATGAVFLWAFLDKLVGLGYSTPSERAWINGGSPARGFLSSVEVGPLTSVFHSIAGTWWANILFMFGLLAIGVALIAGIGLRVAAVAGAVMMVLMWFAEFPPAQHNNAGEPTGSTNPLVDYHIIYALVLVVLAATRAGHTCGLGRWWTRLPLVQKNRWLV